MTQCQVFALSCLPSGLARAFEKVLASTSVSELRLRVGRPVQLICGWESFWLSPNGISRFPGDGLTLSERELDEILFRASGESMQSGMDTIAKGYLPLPGGGRLGVAGAAQLSGETPVSVHSVGSLVFRFPEHFPKAADPILRTVRFPSSLLIAGPPLSGKTTLLRALIGRLAQGTRIAVANERGEFSPLPKEAVSADLLTGYPKALAIEIAVRSLSPEMIVCDELSPGEEKAVMAALFSGVPLAASVHAGSVDELYRREWIRRMIEAGAFQTLALVQKGQVEEIRYVEDRAADTFRGNACSGRNGSGDLFGRTGSRAGGTAPLSFDADRSSGADGFVPASDRGHPGKTGSGRNAASAAG